MASAASETRRGWFAARRAAERFGRDGRRVPSRTGSTLRAAVRGLACEARMTAPLERVLTNPIVRPSMIGFTRATGAFNPGACVDRASGRVVLLVRVYEEESRRSCLAMALSRDGLHIDEIWPAPAVAREAPYEEW